MKDVSDIDDGSDTTGDGDRDSAVETFLRNARRVYREYEEGYVDPDAALWTLEGHIDALEEAFDARDEE